MTAFVPSYAPSLPAWVRLVSSAINSGSIPLPIQAPLTVATLPAATAGARNFVSDANATTFASIVAGGGANVVPVYADGTNWRIG